MGLHEQGIFERSWRKQFHLCAAFCLAVLIAVAPSAAAYAETVRVGGSGGNIGAVKMLAEAFGKTHPGANVVFLPSLGSSGGIKAALSGALDIGLTSRPLTDAERGRGGVETEYARTPFVFAVSKRNGVSGLTLKQIVDIYNDKTEKWPDGGRIRLVLRPAEDSDTATLKGVSEGMSAAVQNALSRKGMIIAITDQDCADSIEKIPGALGTSTLGLIISEERPLKPLVVNGVTPNPRTIADGSYPYHKSLYMVTRKTISASVQEFIDFARSAAGRKILLKTGHWTPGEKRGN